MTFLPFRSATSSSLSAGRNKGTPLPWADWEHLPFPPHENTTRHGEKRRRGAQRSGAAEEEEAPLLLPLFRFKAPQAISLCRLLVLHNFTASSLFKKEASDARAKGRERKSFNDVGSSFLFALPLFCRPITGDNSTRCLQSPPPPKKKRRWIKLPWGEGREKSLRDSCLKEGGGERKAHKVRKVSLPRERWGGGDYLPPSLQVTCAAETNFPFSRPRTSLSRKLRLAV